MIRSIAATLTAIAIAVLATLAGSPAMAAGTHQVERPSVNVENAPEDFAEGLIAAGFKGDPNDGEERLYGPAQVDVEHAPEWLMGALLGMGYHGDPNDGVERLHAPTR
jgi:hypothetical protein